MKKTPKILSLILTIVMILTIMCQPTEASAANAKPVVKATQTVISKGKTTKVKVTCGGKNVTKKATYKSSNKKVATVSKKGVVTGKKAGTTYITATYKGKTSKKVKITVAQVSLNKKNVKLTIGKTATLVAKYNGKKVKAAYRTSNANVAAVDNNGRITAKNAGTATITATYKDNAVSCKVIVAETNAPCKVTKTVVKQATCTEDGIAQYTCSCGESYTEVIKASGHAYDKGVITTEPTATESGVKTYTCTKCGDKKTEKGHYEKKVTKDAYDETVTEDAAVCNGCGKVFSVAEYGSGTAAANAVGEHIALADFFSDCDSYHTEVCTFTVHHEAEYGNVWVADK